MPRATLTSHRSTSCPAIARFEVEYAASHEAVELSYLITGDIAKLEIPARGASTFTDGLWKHTCFELFIGNERDPSYLEFNFSPSSAWAAYRFADYRAGMTALTDLPAPLIAVARDDHELKLICRLPLGALARPARTLLAITAVIELEGGGISSWALEHPAGKPDVHARDGFVLRSG